MVHFFLKIFFSYYSVFCLFLIRQYKVEVKESTDSGTDVGIQILALSLTL